MKTDIRIRKRERTTKGKNKLTSPSWLLGLGLDWIVQSWYWCWAGDGDGLDQVQQCKCNCNNAHLAATTTVTAAIATLLPYYYYYITTSFHLQFSSRFLPIEKKSLSPTEVEKSQWSESGLKHTYRLLSRQKWKRKWSFSFLVISSWFHPGLAIGQQEQAWYLFRITV